MPVLEAAPVAAALAIAAALAGSALALAAEMAERRSRPPLARRCENCERGVALRDLARYDQLIGEAYGHDSVPTCHDSGESRKALRVDRGAENPVSTAAIGSPP